MKKIAIIGAGISGISAAKLLSDKYEVTVFEKESKIGGLIKCDDVNGNLFHRVGGHVFNTKVKEVEDWFWKHFDKEKEFLKVKRNAKILLKGEIVGYPIENYLYQLDENTFQKVLKDLLSLCNSVNEEKEYSNFEDFLRGNFGDALYELYFGPYNKKIWNIDLKNIPLEWLEGKLPMPRLFEIFDYNIRRKGESGMVHATFYYPKAGGSQFIIDRLAQGLTIVTDFSLSSIEKTGTGYILNGDLYFDSVIYTGDVRILGKLFQHKSIELMEACKTVENLRSNGTSNVFCETDDTDISWLYLPDVTNAHRIIYTGNFSPANNRGSERETCVVEFSGKHEKDQMVEQLKLLPGNLSPLDFNYEPNSYIVHEKGTKEKIKRLKDILEPQQFYMTGRFAEWEYYNMDKSIEASMKVRDKIVMSLE